MPTVVKSVRLSTKMVEDIEQLQGPDNFNRVVRLALRGWLKRQRRKAEDEMIEKALKSRSPEQIAEEDRIVRQSGQSTLRILKDSGL
jgi:Arc/MetJ-type ribon-helix-helix transcriptional regulator